MVINVDDWIETESGDIGLVVDTSRMGRATGEVAVYFPTEVECHDVPVNCVHGTFPKVLACRASSVV